MVYLLLTSFNESRAAVLHSLGELRAHEKYDRSAISFAHTQSAIRDGEVRTTC